MSRISQILPSYTVSAVSLPIKNMDSYISAYQSYMDYKQSLQTYKRRHSDLETKAGVKPEDFVRRLDVKEVGKASFPAGDGRVILPFHDCLHFAEQPGISHSSLRQHDP